MCQIHDDTFLDPRKPEPRRLNVVVTFYANGSAISAPTGATVRVLNAALKPQNIRGDKFTKNRLVTFFDLLRHYRAGAQLTLVAIIRTLNSAPFSTVVCRWL